MNKLLGILLVTCLSTPTWAVEKDPWQGWNRQVFKFNQVVDQYAIKPVATAYQKVTPQVVQKGTKNFFSNLQELGNIANNALQLKFDPALKSVGRFAFNSTIGLAGFIDVATAMGIEKQSEDLGQTLATWGVPQGPYLVLPLLGPNTLRDTVNLIPGQDPWNSVSNVAVRNTGTAIRLLNRRVDLLAIERVVVGDQYLFIRDTYLNHRQSQVNDGDLNSAFNESDF